MPGHLDPERGVHMIDVGSKESTRRHALAQGTLSITPKQARALADHDLAKGDWQTTAQLGGIQGAKQCASMIPLCHPLALEHVELEVRLDPGHCEVHVSCQATTTAKTGVEMECMTGVCTALLTVYDMIKGIDKGATIKSVQLVRKEGGRSGTWQRADA